MIISIGYNKEGVEKIPLIFDNSIESKHKIPLYYKTIKQLEKYTDIESIIIPSNIDEEYKFNDYSPVELVKHIRLMKNFNIASNPINIVGDLTSIHDSEFKNSYLEIGVNTSKDKLSTEDLDIIIKTINDESIQSHDISNKWGSYRLLDQLVKLDISLIDSASLRTLKDGLMERYFFNKLINRDEQGREENKITIDEINEFKGKISKIRKRKLQVAVIDDELRSGWKEAYSALFGKNNTHFLYKELTDYEENDSDIRYEIFIDFLSKLRKREFNFDMYDLVILDLRLYEKLSRDSSDMIGIDKISGIQILKSIKEDFPDIPIIMSTASNKSWSYDTALEFGAEGFWSKESPQYGNISKYQFYNTYDLINTIDKLTEWSMMVRPIYCKMMSVCDNLKEKNIAIAKSVEKKLMVVFAQLHISKSRLVEKKSNNGGLVMAYLSVYSLINDIISLRRKEEDGFYCIDVNGELYKFCKIIELEDESSRRLYELTDEAIELIKTETYQVDKKTHYDFNDKAFINCLFEYSGMSKLRSRYGYLSKIRNKLNFLHGKPILNSGDDLVDDLEFSHLEKLVDIWVKLLASN